MAKLLQDELLSALSLTRHDGEIDKQTALRLKKRLAEEFREQLDIGIPTNEDEIGLRRLAAQIRAKKVGCEVFLTSPTPHQTISPLSSAPDQSDRRLASISHR
jgi:hypothetical protein